MIYPFRQTDSFYNVSDLLQEKVWSGSDIHFILIANTRKENNEILAYA